LILCGFPQINLLIQIDALNWGQAQYNPRFATFDFGDLEKAADDRTRLS
jgi:hypothetical protein